MLFSWLGSVACLFCRVRIPTHLFKENVCLDPDPTEKQGAHHGNKNTDPYCCWVFLCYVLFHFVKKFTFIMYSYVVSVYSLNNKRIKIKSHCQGRIHKLLTLMLLRSACSSTQQVQVQPILSQLHTGTVATPREYRYR